MEGGGRDDGGKRGMSGEGWREEGMRGEMSGEGSLQRREVWVEGGVSVSRGEGEVVVVVVVVVGGGGGGEEEEGKVGG